MNKINPPRGTRDLLPDELQQHRYIVNTAQNVARNFGFREVQSPIFEFSPVFTSSLGDTSDIVSRERYIFDDRGGDSLTLRPEGTAGMVRLFVSNGLHKQGTAKLFYQGPMFRYERPQKGRFRQFHQMGVELMGVDKPTADVEVLALAHQVLQQLGVEAELQLNTLGDAESRQNYRNRLVSYYQQHQDQLSADSQNRLEYNPLRILDSKDKTDQQINQQAPKMLDSLTIRADEFFQFVCQALKKWGIPYTVNPQLVRGLDYYGHTVFEFVSHSPNIGSQNAVLAGGRYNNLVEMMGGPHTPSIGWAAGIDRLALLRDDWPQPQKPLFMVVSQSDKSASEAFQLAYELRCQNFKVEIGHTGNMRKHMNRANKWQAAAALIVGPEEVKNKQVQIKNLKTQHQHACARDNVASELQKFT